MVDVELLYRQQLTPADLALLRSVSAAGPVHRVLATPEVEAAVFPPGGGAGVTTAVSPFLTFATAVDRTAVALASASYVPERWGVRARIPVFDAPALRAVLADPLRRYFL